MNVSRAFTKVESVHRSSWETVLELRSSYEIIQCYLPSDEGDYAPF